MSKISLDKGIAYEKKIAKKLSKVFGRHIVRTPDSGSISGKGDIIDPVNPLPIFIECKYSKAFRFGDLLNDNSVLYNYWDKLLLQCPENQKPVLIFQGGHFFKDMVMLCEHYNYFYVLSFTTNYTTIFNYNKNIKFITLQNFLKI